MVLLKIYILKCEDSWRVDLTSVIASKVLKKCVQLWQNSEMLFQNIYVDCSTKTPFNRFHFFFYYFPYLYIFTLLKLLKILGFSQDEVSLFWVR